MEIELANPEETARRIDAWLSRMTHVSDPALRVASFRNELETLSADALARALEDLAAAADAGVREFADLLLFVAIALAARELDARRLEAGRHARNVGLFAATELLLPETPASVLETKAEVVAISGRPLTQGERKSLARTRSRGLRDRLARDPSRDVIRVLLANPALTESDVVRLVARRPIDPGILREVFVSTRFIVRQAVRRALAKNPATETHLAFAILRGLSRMDSREIAESSELAPNLRETALRLSKRLPLH